MYDWGNVLLCVQEEEYNSVRFTSCHSKFFISNKSFFIKNSINSTGQSVKYLRTAIRSQGCAPTLYECPFCLTYPYRVGAHPCGRPGRLPYTNVLLPNPIRMSLLPNLPVYGRGVLFRPLRSPWKIISFQKRIMTTNQMVIPRNFLQGWPRLRVNLLYSQAEHAACAVETRRHTTVALVEEQREATP